MPAVTPVTTPPATVAAVLLLLHTPPGTLSDKVALELTHTPDAPVIVPAFGDAFTVTVFVVVASPHPLLTE